MTKYTLLCAAAGLAGMLAVAPQAEAQSCNCQPTFSASYHNGNIVTDAPVAPYPVATDIATYYSYDNPIAASSNSPGGMMERPEEMLILLSRDPSGIWSLAYYVDEPGDGTGGSIDLDITGAFGASIAVENDPFSVDPSDLHSLNAATGVGAFEWNWDACCNDGAAIEFGQCLPEEVCMMFSNPVNVSYLRFCAWDQTTGHFDEFLWLDLAQPLYLRCETRSSDTEDLPTSFQLADAFPNPFNPTTTIGYSLANSAEVTLDVYSLQGDRIARLVDGLVSRGSHEVVFDATGLSSGTYLYTLEAEGQRQTKRLTLVK